MIRRRLLGIRRSVPDPSAQDALGDTRIPTSLATPRSLTSLTGASLNSRLNIRRPITILRLSAHQTGRSSIGVIHVPGFLCIQPGAT